MQRHIIYVTSITYAIKGRDVLRKNGFKSYIERKTNSNGTTGCGYVIVAEGNKNKIVSTLTNFGVSVLEIKSIA